MISKGSADSLIEFGRLRNALMVTIVGKGKERVIGANIMCQQDNYIKQNMT